MARSSTSGQGRPKGARNKKTVETIAAVEASGLMPLDYMLTVMRDPSLPMPDRMDAAKGAAPYVHARLSSVEAKTENKHTVTGWEWEIIHKAATRD